VDGGNQEARVRGPQPGTGNIEGLRSIVDTKKKIFPHGEEEGGEINMGGGMGHV